MRHQLTLTAPAGTAFDTWLAALPEAELSLPGHVVADLGIERVEAQGDETQATIAVLTLAAD